MDLLVATALVRRLRADREPFVEVDKSRAHAALQAVHVIVNLAISTASAYLSWSCNTTMGCGVVYKSVCAALAFAFGLTYLVLYAVFSASACSALVKRK